MKRIACALLLFLLLGVFSSLDVRVNMTTKGDGSEVTQASNLLTIDFSFPPPLMVSKLGGYYSVSMGGLPNLENPGEPVLPFKPAKILMPQGRSVKSVEVSASSSVTLKDKYFIEYALTPQPLLANANVKDQPNEEIYRSENPFPDSLVSQGSYQYLRGYQILILNLYPVRYIPATGELSYFGHMTARVELQDCTVVSPYFRGARQDCELVRATVDNGDVLNSYLEAGNESSHGYAIITSDTLKSSFQPLANWKIQRGLNAKIVTVESIMNNSKYNCDGIFGDGYGSPKFNDTQAHIRNFIKDAYLNWGTEYVLLGGDDEIIPARGVYCHAEPWEDYNIPCDMYYGCLDGSWDKDNDTIFGEAVQYWSGSVNATAGDEADFYAEVYVGRATVDNMTEAANFVYKTIAYEQSYDPNYLKKALMIGEQLDDITEGGNGADTVTEIIPQYTTMRLYTRDGTFSISTVISEMNNGPHIIYHDGHGAYGYVMGLSISDVGSLTNTNYFLAYSAACHSAAFDTACSGISDAIGEHFISSAHGAFAYIGNSRFGTYWSNSTDGPGDVFARSFFSVLNSGTRNLGKALQLSKEANFYKAIEPERWIVFDLNLLGDPETPIVTAVDSPTAHFQTRTDLITPPTVSGVVSLQGSAKRGLFSSSTFRNFTVQYSLGTCPSYWTTYGVNLTGNGQNEVINGKLAMWDTNLVDSGRYTLRLLVFDCGSLVGEDRKVVLVSSNGTAAYNIAISGVLSFKAVIGQGFADNMNVTVSNPINLPGTFNLAIYSNKTLIWTDKITLLGADANGGSTTVTLTWSTLHFAYGNYSIWAYATPVLNEVNTAYDNCTGGTISVSIPGDLNGDFKVDLQDLVILALHCGHHPVEHFQETDECWWCFNADIDNDGIVDIFDAIILANHFNQHYP